MVYVQKEEKKDKNKPQFVRVSLSKWRFKNWYLAKMFWNCVSVGHFLKKSINNMFAVVEVSIMRLRLCESLSLYKGDMTGLSGGIGDGWRWICAALLTSGGDRQGDGSVKISIKSRKTQLAPNITSDSFLDQLLPWHPTEEQIAFLAGHLDTPALIDMDPSMPSQARRQFNMSNTVISI